MAQERDQTILPKGIVLNRNTIYQEIAKYDVIPVEQILRACHVFSTTSRKLYDPTARRLENFWTRMLGGDRRYLPGMVVAHLFREISEETAFVKLRGPDNRYEPPSPESASSKPQGISVTSGTSASKTKSSSATSTKVLHPILKKPRGPSASGPRPTARFVSPAGSEVDERGGKGGETATSTEATTQNANSKDSGKPTAAKEERKKGQAVKPKKKGTAFVASTSSRRRPAMPRRSSSQSSTTSDHGPKDKDSSSIESRYDGALGLISTIPEKPELTDKNKGKGNLVLSAKAAGKRPVSQSEWQAEFATSKPGSVQEGGAQPPKSQAAAPARGGEGGEEGGEEVAGRQRSLRERAKPGTLPARDIIKMAPSLARQNSREASRVIMPPSSLTSTSLTKVDTSVGQGTMSGVRGATTIPKILGGRSGARPGDSPGADSNTQHQSGSEVPPLIPPTVPSTTVPIPLARSKSQLSLLLQQKRPKQR